MRVKYRVLLVQDVQYYFAASAARLWHNQDDSSQFKNIFYFVVFQKSWKISKLGLIRINDIGANS